MRERIRTRMHERVRAKSLVVSHTQNMLVQVWVYMVLTCTHAPIYNNTCMNELAYTHTQIHTCTCHILSRTQKHTRRLFHKMT